jgi:hypothetical protein
VAGPLTRHMMLPPQQKTAHPCLQLPWNGPNAPPLSASADPDTASRSSVERCIDACVELDQVSVNQSVDYAQPHGSFGLCAAGWAVFNFIVLSGDQIASAQLVNVTLYA